MFMLIMFLDFFLFLFLFHFLFFANETKKTFLTKLHSKPFTRINAEEIKTT